MTIAAVEHGSGVVRGQTASDGAGGEILGVRRLLRELGVAGRTVTLDALHSCPKTARLIVAEGGDYVMPVKANRPTLLDDIQMLDWNAAPARQTVDKAHGRLEQRTCAVVPLDGVDDDIAALPGRRQAFRVVRHGTVLKTARTSVEAAYGLTSLAPEQAGPSEILALNRGHWEIENRVHYVRDVTYDEDRSRVRTGRLPQNLACLSNAAISIVRMRRRFRHQPQAPPLRRPTRRGAARGPRRHRLTRAPPAPARDARRASCSHGSRQTSARSAQAPAHGAAPACTQTR